MAIHLPRKDKFKLPTKSFILPENSGFLNLAVEALQDFTGYVTGYDISGDYLNPNPLSRSITKTPADGKIGYSLSFDNTIDLSSGTLSGLKITIQDTRPIIVSGVVPSIAGFAKQRIKNAKYYDKHFSKIPGLIIPPRPKNYKIVYHLYIIFAEERDKLLKYCIKKGIEAKIHYPVPAYKQKAMNYLKLKDREYPVTNSHLKKIITFPCDQHKTKRELNHIIKTVKNFYNFNV